jgi:hypothetical protein
MCFSYDRKRQKYCFKLLISVVHDHRKEIGGNCPDIQPLRFNQLSKQA